MRLEWSTATGRTAISDAKSLAAARRKRSEIRRFRLMAAAAPLEDDVDEPTVKRSKACHLLQGCAVLHEISEAKEQRCIPTVGGHNHDMQATPAAPTMSASGSSARSSSHSAPVTPSLQSCNEGDDGRSLEESRAAVPHNNGACPSHCVVSICGRSRTMEDAAIAVPSFVSLPSSNAGQRHGDTYHFYGVYDGHGSPQAAEYCKERMHGALADEMSAAGDGLSGQWEACFQSCFTKLDAELCGLCPHGSECPRKVEVSTMPSTTPSSSCREPLVPGSVGTTAVVAVVGSQHIVVGNCGDSRAVLCRGGQVVPLSFDHKASRPDEVARIEAAGGYVFTWQGHRVCGVLAMSRALGDGFLKPFVTGLPEVTVTPRSDDDECLILASDGLWDVLSNEFVCGVARKALANWRRQHKDLDQKKVSKVHFSVPHASVEAEDSPAQGYLNGRGRENTVDQTWRDVSDHDKWNLERVNELLSRSIQPGFIIGGRQWSTIY